MDLTDLYHGPLGEFIARRRRLIAETRGADPAAAAAIESLRKPPLSAWAIDQLAIDQQDLLVELLAAGADTRAAHQLVGDPVATREDLLLATGRLRDAVEQAARAADTVLEAAGRSGGEDVARRIRTTLQSAATGTGADRLALWRGTLDHDVEPSGFGAVDTPDDDPPELVEILAPRRRSSSEMRRATRPVRLAADDARAQREAAGRAVQKKAAAAERLRDLAAAKQLHADTMSAEARVAEEEALAAEDAAGKAEDEAAVARSGLTR